TSTWRSLATISSAVCFFRPMKTSSTWLEAIPQGGPLFRRQASLSAIRIIDRIDIYYRSNLFDACCSAMHVPSRSGAKPLEKP
ncbi:hypothetical protein, partial [Methylobacterium sp. WL120]|uniref:hypothetical protein n=1 Tax=Methylobacterium sp. WL120 TaxID=2603887 RepID=UPI001AEE9C28